MKWIVIDGLGWNMMDRIYVMECDGMRWNAMECDGMRWNVMDGMDGLECG